MTVFFINGAGIDEISREIFKDRLLTDSLTLLHIQISQTSANKMVTLFCQCSGVFGHVQGCSGF
jgi:hypothetical protein